MKVILKRDVKGLGREGDLKEVKGGYACNFLLTTGAAVVADKGAVANWERHRDQREARDRSVRAEAEATAERLSALRLEVPVKAGERGRLFGAVTGHQIADLIHAEGIEGPGQLALLPHDARNPDDLLRERDGIGTVHGAEHG